MKSRSLWRIEHVECLKVNHSSCEARAGSKGREISTTMCFAQILRKMMQACSIHWSVCQHFRLYSQSITSIGLQWKAGEFGQRVTLMVTDESWAEKGNQTVRAFKEKISKSRNNYNLVCHWLLRVEVSMAAPIQLAWPRSEICSSLAARNARTQSAISRVLLRLSGFWSIVLPRLSGTVQLTSVASDLWGRSSEAQFPTSLPFSAWHRAWRCTLLILTA